MWKDENVKDQKAKALQIITYTEETNIKRHKQRQPIRDVIIMSKDGSYWKGQVREIINPKPNQSLSNIEECLFRYRSINENNLKALSTNRLYFSLPTYFNDPFDNLIYANSIFILDRIVNCLNLNMDGFLNSLVAKDPIKAGFGFAAWNGAEHELITAQFLNRVGNIVSYLNDALRNTVKMICFSDRIDSMLMWSHYADYHKGYAVAYERNAIEKALFYDKEGNEIRKKPILRQVHYTNKRLDLTDEIEHYLRCNLTPYSDEVSDVAYCIPAEKLRTAVLEKDLDWSYENEWRLIPKFINLFNESKLTYMVLKPKFVVLGAKCEDNNKKQICKMVSDQ